MTRTHIKAALVVLTVLCALLPAAHAADEAEADAKAQLPSIYVVEAKSEKITDSVIASGYIRPVEEVYVQPEVEGLAVQSTDIDIGDSVEKGEIMAVLSPDSLKLQKSQLEATRAKAEAGLAQSKAQLAEAQANADEAVRVRDRYKVLSKKGTLSTANFEEARANASAAVARVNSAKQSLAVGKADVAGVDAQIDDVELRLARTEVKAPVSGVVSAKTIKIGAIASASSMPLFTIIKNDALELRADLSEENVVKVEAGQKALVTLAGGQAPLKATVRLVEPTVDLDSRLGGVRIAFDDPERVRAGMFATARILVATNTSVVVPLPAVSISDGKASVLKVTDGRVAITAVETGYTEDGRIEVKSGLKAGDQLVAKAGAFVRDGEKVNPVPLDSVEEAANAPLAAAVDGN